MPRAAVFPRGSATGGIVIDFETLDELKEKAAQHMGINVGSVFDDSGAIIKHQQCLNKTISRSSTVDSFSKSSTVDSLSRTSSVDSLKSIDEASIIGSMRAEVFLHGSKKGSKQIVIGFDTLDQLKERAGQHMGIAVGSAFGDCGAILEDVRHLVQLLETHEETIVGLRKNNGIHFATAVCRKNSNSHEPSSDDAFMALDEELRGICEAVIKERTLRDIVIQCIS